jgi:hypothetical protein
MTSAATVPANAAQTMGNEGSSLVAVTATTRPIPSTTRIPSVMKSTRRTCGSYGDGLVIAHPTHSAEERRSADHCHFRCHALSAYHASEETRKTDSTELS